MSAAKSEVQPKFAVGHAHGNHPQQTQTEGYSNLWSGQITGSGGPFNSISGYWLTPTVNHTDGQNRNSAQWLGLGAIYSGTGEQLVQAGTEVDTNSSGGVSVFPWWEVYPAVQPSVIIPNVAVSQGDVMYENITGQGSTSYFFFEDVSTGVAATPFSEPWGCGCSYAEGIVERPGGTNLTWLNTMDFAYVAPQNGGGAAYLENFSPFNMVLADPPCYCGGWVEWPSPVTSPGVFYEYRGSND